MRRADKEIREPEAVAALLARARTMRLGMIDPDGWPYVVPVCFGVSGKEIFVHCAREGRKMDALRADPRVCFEVDLDAELRPGESACKWGMAFRSVVGFGTADFPDAPEEKRRALDAVMEHYGAPGPHDYSDAAIRNTAVLRIRIRSMTGKQGGYPAAAESS